MSLGMIVRDTAIRDVWGFAPKTRCGCGLGAVPKASMAGPLFRIVRARPTISTPTTSGTIVRRQRVATSGLGDFSPSDMSDLIGTVGGPDAMGITPPIVPTSGGSGSIFSAITDAFGNTSIGPSNVNVVTTSPGSSAPGVTGSVMSLIGGALNNIVAPILKAQYGGPQPGQYFATGPNGQSTAYALPTGATSSAFSSIGMSSFSGMLPLLLVGGGMLLLFSFIGRK